MLFLLRLTVTVFFVVLDGIGAGVTGGCFLVVTGEGFVFMFMFDVCGEKNSASNNKR